MLNDAYYKTLYTERIEQYFPTIFCVKSVQKQLAFVEEESKHKEGLVKRVVDQWRSYTRKRQQLRTYLSQVGK